jgi:hypothetical protein
MSLQNKYDRIVLSVGKPTQDFILAHNTADALFVAQAYQLGKEGHKKEAVKTLETMFNNSLNNTTL